MSIQIPEGLTVALIAAMSSSRVIGVDNQLPWHLPADLQFFKATTMHKPVVMGRKTFESIGKPLPGRLNVVVSRQPDLKIEGVEVVASLEQAIEVAAQSADHGEIMVIGGTQIYNQAISLANKLYITEVDCDVEGDAHFPVIDSAQWQVISKAAHKADDRHAYDFAFVIYEKKSA